MDGPHFAYLFLLQGTLGLFPLLPIVNNAALDISVQISLQALLSSLLGTYPEVGLLGRMVTLCATF